MTSDYDIRPVGAVEIVEDCAETITAIAFSLCGTSFVVGYYSEQLVIFTKLGISLMAELKLLRAGGDT